MSAPILVLSGATGTGKTGLALELAEAMGAEIIGADSQQIYRGLPIGTAAPDAEALARVPHHLVGSHGPTDELSAAVFLREASALAEEIRARGRVPLVVGGTFFWIRGLLYGLAEAPSSDPALRAALEAEVAAAGVPALHARLAEVDPESAARLHPNDRQRVVRAFEVFQATGRPLSALQAAHDLETPTRPFRLLATRQPRERHRALIAGRVEQMLDAGWLDEAQAAAADPAWALRLPKVLGYSEVLEWGGDPARRAEVVERIRARTWHYARRQGMWLRKASALEWIDPGADLDALCADLRAWWESQRP